MKYYRSIQEIAPDLNFGKYPVLKLDLKDLDEYGLKGSLCRIDQGEFRDGEKWYEKAELRVYRDEKKITFSGFGCCLSKEKSYSDFMDDVELAMSPVIKPNSSFILVIYDSIIRKIEAVCKVDTKHTIKHCTTPIAVEEVNMTEFLRMAEANYGGSEQNEAQ